MTLPSCLYISTIFGRDRDIKANIAPPPPPPNQAMHNRARVATYL